MSTPIQQVQDFYAALHRGGTHAYCQQIGKFPMGTYWWRVGEPMRLPMQEKGAAIYIPVNPLSVRVTDEDRKNHPGKADKWIENRVAGKDSTVECVNALYREYDGKDFTGGKGKAEKERIYKTSPEYYKGLALTAVRKQSDLFSVVADSGGGYNTYTLFKETFYINSEADRKYIEDLQKRWVAMDPCADQSVNDLRRIFRPVGTMNYKDLYAPNYPTVSFYQYDLSVAFSHQSLHAMLPVVAVTPAPARQPSHNQARAATAPYQGESVIDAFNAAHRIEDGLDKYDYPKAGLNKRSYPGTTNRCISVFPETNSCRSWSDSDTLAHNGGRKIDCFTLYRIWEHNGDMKAAIEGARALLGMEKKTPQPEPMFRERIAAIREWVVGADFSQIIPKHLQSAKGYRTAATDKRAFDACLDIFEQYGKFDGPISKMQGSRASGLSENTFRSAMKRLEQSPLLDRMTPTEQVQDGAFWYSMTVAYLDRVCCSKAAIATRSRYATVFSENKAEDAWQLTGSKYQRALAKLDKSCGPDMLLAVAVLPVGERVHQAVFGEWIHKNKSATSRLVKKMEYFSIVSTEHIGRQQYITLLPDWQERIARLVDFMPTAGNRTRREWGLDTRLVERIDKKLGLKAGNPVRLLAQREQAMRRLTAIMESDMQGMDADLMAEKMRRLLRADSLRRNASAEKKTVQSLDVATHRNNQAKAPWLSKNSPAVERRVNELMQELEENEMLLEARAELRRAA